MKSKTQEVSWDGTTLRTPMASITVLPNIDVYGMLDSEALMDHKTQEPIIDMIGRDEPLSQRLLVFTNGHLFNAELLDVRDIQDTDGKTYRLVTILEKLLGTAGDTARFLGFNLYELKG